MYYLGIWALAVDESPSAYLKKFGKVTKSQQIVCRVLKDGTLVELELGSEESAAHGGKDKKRKKDGMSSIEGNYVLERESKKSSSSSKASKKSKLEDLHPAHSIRE
jgi:hypothetical protein